MAKIPFNIKYRPQIESGEYKVETRYGFPVRIVCWDLNDSRNSLVVLIKINDGNEVVNCVKLDGRVWDTEDNVYDLFLVPKSEESEDERMVRIIENVICTNEGEVVAKKYGLKLTDLADWLEKAKEQKPSNFDDDTEVGLDRALQIVKAARGNLSGYQTDGGVYECDHAIQTLECLLKSGIVRKPSEDEQRLINTTISFLKGFADDGYENATECIYWLKFLLMSCPKSLNNWKPSEEQMHSLSIALDRNDRIGYDLHTLYNDLKKLM